MYQKPNKRSPSSTKCFGFKSTISIRTLVIACPSSSKAEHLIYGAEILLSEIVSWGLFNTYIPTTLYAP